MASETIEVTGHIVDSLLLAKILDSILDAGCDYEIADVAIGKTSLDPSRARIDVTGDDEVLGRLLDELQVHGANRVTIEDATLVPADRDGVLPAGFYSTTNLASGVRVDGTWLPVENPEMDCALVVRDGRATPSPCTGCAGDMVVVGSDGVQVQAPSHAAAPRCSSSWRPRCRPRSRRPCWSRWPSACATPATGAVGCWWWPGLRSSTRAGPDLARLVEAGWVDVLFAGNGFATHDIEANVLGTSLGVSVEEGTPTEGGHANHLRVINEVRRHGSIAAAVDAGFVTGGVMRACVQRGVPFVLGGSIRDDGPCPTSSPTPSSPPTHAGHLDGVQVALMLASTLHAIATGNCLPAGVETFCVDINQAVDQAGRPRQPPGAGHRHRRRPLRPPTRRPPRGAH